MRPRRGTVLSCYFVVLGGVVEDVHRCVVAGDPLDPHALRLKVWAYDPLDAFSRVEDALTSLIEAENDGEIARVPDPGSG